MMDEAGVGNLPARYRAFISYSHTDSRFAGWLHRKLEAWKLADGARLAPIFIDRAELAAGPDLSSQVREALAESAALIVIASPAARTSQWVAQEIALFRELHPERPVLAALLDGEPNDAFPEPLLKRGGEALEPLAADFREGRDGKRLALLKIVAGLTAQPLDRLVQRDAQARTRRVMWITAGALLLSLVLAALLVIALRARSEAERQRAEAEGMVEFMLTDLRDKLKGVGRLDVMDAVNERAMAHYAADQGFTLPDSTMLRRAKLLQTMAEDSLATSKGIARGTRQALQAYAITSPLLAKSPKDPKRILAHAQSEFWVGYAAFGDHDAPAAERHWNAYLTLARQLVSNDPSDLTYQREVVYAEGNLCTLAMNAPVNPKAALDHCSAARSSLQHLTLPQGLQATLDLANRLAWEADALSANRLHQQALARRQEQLDLIGQARKKFGQDSRIDEAELMQQVGLARNLLAAGRREQAAATARSAEVVAAGLLHRDPANAQWRAWHDMAAQALSRARNVTLN